MIKEALRKHFQNRLCIPKIMYCKLFCMLTPADKRLLQYKGIHQGERCFIVGTAPSLTLSDIEKLNASGETTFSCNSIIKTYDKTDWRPTYFLLFDPYFYSLYRDTIDHMESSVLFYNQLQIPSIGRDGIRIKGSVEHLIHEYMKHKRTTPRLELSTDITRKLMCGQSTLHSGITLAVWMGFTEIYLLGIDCDYDAGQHAEVANDDRLKSTTLDGEEMVKDFIDLKPQLEHLNVHIENCSRGGKLKAFPCRTLESVLAVPRKEGKK